MVPESDTTFPIHLLFSGSDVLVPTTQRRRLAKAIFLSGQKPSGVVEYPLSRRLMGMSRKIKQLIDQVLNVPVLRKDQKKEWTESDIHAANVASLNALIAQNRRIEEELRLEKLQAAAAAGQHTKDKGFSIPTESIRATTTTTTTRHRSKERPSRMIEHLCPISEGVME